MHGISIKAIVVAMLAVLAANLVAAIALVVTLDAGQSADELVQSAPVLIAGLVVATLTIALGGYAAARMAKARHYVHALVIGVLGLVLGIVTADGEPMLFSVVSYVLTLPAALLGGYLAKPKAEGVRSA